MVIFWFVFVVMGVAIVIFFIWINLIGNLIMLLIIIVSVLIIVCFCVLGLVIFIFVMVGIGKGVENGILIKGVNSLEVIYKIEIIILDKIGIFIKGRFIVIDYIII